ncbi:ABC transporter permease [Microbacterium sp. G2-8]|uniref:ABC transporter permease n=1 Tax=Microbacterium sp. G2-8 TaxID=2842454 RepID=UPI001C8ADFA0|nr:ABC transporter permease [Microbacterium sp. G2-8]
MSTPAVAPVSTSQATLLVAEREVVTRVRSKAFIISTALLLVGIIAGVFIMNLMADRETTTTVAAPAAVAAQLQGSEGLEVTEASSRADAEQLVRDEEVDAAVVNDESSPTGVAIIALTEAPEELLQILSQSPAVELLDPEGGWSPLRYIMGIAFGVIFMAASMSFGLPVATSVVEEKQTRVIEILITAIPARALLAGKVLGNTVMALGQIILIVAAVAISLILTGQTDILGSLGAPILWFALFFVTGFLLIATMFAATGAMVSRQEDINSSIAPIMYLVMIPYMLVIFFSDNPLVMTIMSYVPFSSPVSMPIRLFFNEAQWWEPLISIAISLVACVAVIGIASKIYENSLLRMGAKVKWREALSK